MPRLAKQAHWRERVSAFERGGLTRRAWCLRTRVAVASLDNWRARLRDLSRPGQALVPIVVSEEPVVTIRCAGGDTVEIEVGGMRLRADVQVDARWLASVLRGLR
jgi:hypothetical protein